ncbi:hypothetical protein RHSP_38139 [Rhizobium freirei PRF 81]|uniref:Uncharacterized protein n=1 Tax=Rhizobium freirei PRF 81 TaxID=363754 RepID=N6UF69_9HYPH|nr:hypothetical protein RHSP_38139 [Rhizobium freirei PRF 81]
MAMAEGIDHIRCRPGAADRRQAVGQRRPEAHPLLSPLRVEAGQEGSGLLQHGFRAFEVRRQRQSAQLHGTTDANARRELADDEAVAAEGYLRTQIEGIRRKRRVVAALGFERYALTKRFGDPMRESAGGQNDLAGLAQFSIRCDGFDTARKRTKRRNLRPLDDTAPAAEMLGQRQRVKLGIGNGIPSGRKRAEHEARCQSRLDRRHLVGLHMPEFDPVIAANLPAGQRSAEFRLALIDLEIALLAQHGERIGRREEGLKLRPGKVHQACLRRRGVGNARGLAGPPEAKHPGRDLKRVGWRHGKRPERIEQPFRRLLQDARRCERQDIREGEGAGIAG